MIYLHFTIALKAEVKQESRYFKSVIENFKEVFILLEKSQITLTKELEERRREQTIAIEDQQKRLLKPLLCDLIEIRDRLEAGIDYNTTYYSLSFILRPFKKIRSFVEGMKEGNLITLRHIDNVLSTYDVTLLETLSQMFDPKFMRAVGIQSEEDLPSGLVLEEVRKGFLWRNEVLRVADVKVNKIP